MGSGVLSPGGRTPDPIVQCRPKGLDNPNSMASVIVLTVGMTPNTMKLVINFFYVNGIPL